MKGEGEGTLVRGRVETKQPLVASSNEVVVEEGESKHKKNLSDP